MSKIKVCIDAGHGFFTKGKESAPFTKDVDINGDGTIDIKKGERLKEHVANVGVSNFLYKELERCGCELIKTGWNDDNAYDDPDTPLSERQKIIKLANCKYSISVHFNASGDGKSFNSGEGVVTYFHSTAFKDSKRFAECVQNHLIQGTKQVSRGIKQNAFAMVNCNVMGTEASILCELAFMTNEREAQELMANESFWKECAVEIAKGFCEYAKIPYVEEPKEEPKKSEIVYRVRKEGNSPKTQIGAFRDKDNAIAMCKSSGSEYRVYDSNAKLIYKPVKVSSPSNTDTVKSDTIYRIRKEGNKPSTQVGAFTELPNAISMCQSKGKEYRVYDSHGKLIYAPTTATPSQPKPVEKKPEEPKKVYLTVYVDSNLRCRKSASLLSSVVGKFKNGTKVELLDKTNKTWWKVTGKDINGKTITGYCSSAYLK